MRSTLALTAVAGAILISSPLLAQSPLTPAGGPDAVVKAGVTGAVGSVAAPAAATVSPAAAPAQAIPATAAASPTEPSQPEEPTKAAGPEKPKPTPPSLVAKINLTTQRMEVAVDGQPKHSWAISSGRAGYLTPRGSFRVQWTAKLWHSRKYDMAPMPHSVFFKDGVAVHATNATGMLGRPASHGCVRLAPANAATFYALVQKHGYARTQIQVFGSHPGEQVAERPSRANERTAASRDLRSPLPRHAGAAPHYFPPGSPYHGRPAYVQNGIVYVKVR